MLPRDMERGAPWALAVGAAAGASAIAFAVLRAVRARRSAEIAGPLDALEDAAVEALRADVVAGSCAIDVAAVGPGIIELTGVVPTHEASQRAARVLHSVPGVRTVVNRLEEGWVESRLAGTRTRRQLGDAQLQERHWYGVRVGTGQRRQSQDTEPKRPDDTVARRTRELEVAPDELADAASSRPVTPGDVP